MKATRHRRPGPMEAVLLRRRTLPPHTRGAWPTRGWPRNPPPAWPSRQRPPATRRSQGQHQRPQVRSLPRRTPSSAAPHQAHGRRGDAHGPAGAHAACPHQEQPPPRLSAEDTPWANRPGKGPRPKSIEGGPSNSFGKGAPAGKQLLFYPPGQLQKSTKKHKAILHREINHTALLLTEAAKLSNDVLRPTPTKPSCQRLLATPRMWYPPRTPPGTRRPQPTRRFRHVLRPHHPRR